MKLIDYSVQYETLNKKPGEDNGYLTIGAFQAYNEQDLQQVMRLELGYAPPIYYIIEPKVGISEGLQPIFTRDELVRFGYYLLSPERRDLYSKTPQEGFSLEDRLSQVNHADVENFIDLITNGTSINGWVGPKA
jgi:hypothetical protein